MATKTSIKFSTIHKRSQCINSRFIAESKREDSEKLYENLSTILQRSKTGKEASVQCALRSYLESLCNTENINRDYWRLLNIIGEFNSKDTKVSDTIVYEFTNRILPYMESPKEIIPYLENYNISESQKDSIIETANIYNTADRIVKNNKFLAKTFNIESFINRYTSAGLKYFVDSCASMFDTYTQDKFANYQKLNNTIEECCYSIEKNGFKEHRGNIAKYSLESFLTNTPIISESDIRDYKRTIKKSYMLEESDINQIQYLFNENFEVNSVETGIQKFLLSNKNENTISGMIEDIINNSTKEDIVYNSDKIISTLWDIAKHEVLESDQCLYTAAISLANYISCNESISLFTKEDIEKIINSYKNTSKSVEISGNYNPAYAKSASDFIKEAINPCIDALSYTKDLLYTKENIEAINYVNSKSNILPLNEFRIFKFNNLVKAAFNLDKFLKVKEKRFYNNTKIKVNKLAKKAKNILFGEASEIQNNMFNYIGDDFKADICIKQYFYDESDLSDLSQFLNNVCLEYNDVLMSQSETCRVYYIINPGLAELRIKESTSVELENTDIIYKNLDPSMDTYIEALYSANESCNICDNISTNSIEDMILNITNCKEFTLDEFKTALEAMSLIGVAQETISFFANTFNDYNFNYAIENKIINESYIKLASQEREVSNLVSNYKISENVDDEDKVKCYGYLAEIFEAYKFPDSADDIDDEDDDDSSDNKSNTKKEKELDKKQKEKKPSEIYKDEVKSVDDIKIPTDAPKEGYKSNGFNLSGIKLALNGIKTKYKEMSTKEKELSRNMDNATRAFVKGIKDSLVSDRREAIIKGSVIPSFSRCIKIGIGLGFIGCFSLTSAVILAIGGFALSKKLTKQERLLLLDEIETELDVVDKELAIADSNNQINKYRELLKYKKNLQRQYQRIKYNIRIGKDILPGSSSGMRED